MKVTTPISRAPGPCSSAGNIRSNAASAVSASRAVRASSGSGDLISLAGNRYSLPGLCGFTHPQGDRERLHAVCAASRRLALSLNGLVEAAHRSFVEILVVDGYLLFDSPSSQTHRSDRPLRHHIPAIE